jgi:hypothetical protein
MLVGRRLARHRRFPGRRRGAGGALRAAEELGLAVRAHRVPPRQLGTAPGIGAEPALHDAAAAPPHELEVYLEVRDELAAEAGEGGIERLAHVDLSQRAAGLDEDHEQRGLGAADVVRDRERVAIRRPRRRHLAPVLEEEVPLPGAALHQVERVRVANRRVGVPVLVLDDEASRRARQRGATGEASERDDQRGHDPGVHAVTRHPTPARSVPQEVAPLFGRGARGGGGASAGRRFRLW